MQRRLGPTQVLNSLLGFILILVSNSALAQYQATRLDSDLAGQAIHADGERPLVPPQFLEALRSLTVMLRLTGDAKPPEAESAAG